MPNYVLDRSLQERPAPEGNFWRGVFFACLFMLAFAAAITILLLLVVKHA